MKAAILVMMDLSSNFLAIQKCADKDSTHHYTRLPFPSVAYKTVHMQLQRPVIGRCLYDETVDVKRLLVDGIYAGQEIAYVHM